MNGIYQSGNGYKGIWESREPHRDHPQLWKLETVNLPRIGWPTKITPRAISVSVTIWQTNAKQQLKASLALLRLVYVIQKYERHNGRFGLGFMSSKKKTLLINTSGWICRCSLTLCWIVRKQNYLLLQLFWIFEKDFRFCFQRSCILRYHTSFGRM